MNFSNLSTRSQYSPVYLTWVAWFGLSKVAELGDTIFLVLRKRPLTFLHVYHHCTVLVFTWYLCGQMAQTGRWFSTMNFLIHSIMYSYYALQVLRWFRFPKTISVTITFLQVILRLYNPSSHKFPRLILSYFFHP